MSIVSVADRPDLLPVVCDWVWRAFWQPDGHTLAEVQAAYAASVQGTGLQRSFVSLHEGQPAGTASLVESDLDERPALTPWLAAVYVPPEARGHGHALRLVAAVEQACRAAAFPRLWLYTTTAEGLYRKAGWSLAETVPRPGKPAATLMRKDV